MILILLVLAKVCPIKSWSLKLMKAADKIRRYCYGGLSPQDVQSLRREIFSDVQHQLSAARMHAASFKGFKNIFSGRDVVIVGAGPSVSKYKPLKNCIHISLNRACAIEAIRFDYMFAIDYRGIRNYLDAFGRADCVKFVGDQGIGQEGQIPESVVATFNGDIHRYKTDAGHVSDLDSHFATDLEAQVLGNFSTVAMHAMQFALYGNARRIYLAGVDCSAAGHFDANKANEEKSCYSSSSKAWAADARVSWLKLKEFVGIYYPATEIISINPVGLKGVFVDLFQS